MGMAETAERPERISPREFHAASGVEDWRVVGEGACAHFRTGSLAAAAELVRAISALPEVESHRPHMDVRDGGVTVRLITLTPGLYGLTARDLDLARQVSAAARDLGL